MHVPYGAFFINEFEFVLIRKLIVHCVPTFFEV
jgi:hypothetical protein